MLCLLYLNVMFAVLKWYVFDVAKCYNMFAVHKCYISAVPKSQMLCLLY